MKNFFLIICILFSISNVSQVLAQSSSLSPVAIEEEDPLLKEAVEKAKGSLSLLRELYQTYPDDTTVKVPFITSSGQLEYLWGQLRSMDDKDMEVFLLTPPVTHTGEVERLQKYPVSELQDWAVYLPDGKIRGGFSMKVNYIRARETGQEIPKDALEMEKLYVDHK